MNIYLILLLTIFSCNKEIPAQFSEEALNDSFVTLIGETILFKDILKKHEGKTIMIDVWASWCKDCIKGMPKVKKIQDKFPDVEYMFLSLDRNMASWKKGIEKHQVKGNHYFMQSGWNGPFGEFLNLDWIPRYMVINKQGHIKLYKAKKATDKNIINALQ